MATTQSGIDTEIDTNLASGKPGGILAADLRPVLHDINAAAFTGASGAGANTKTYILKSDLQNDHVPSGIQYARVLAVAGAYPAPAGQVSTPLTYRRVSSSSLYGNVTDAGGQIWEPIYSTYPVNCGEFGTVGDAVSSMFSAGGSFMATYTSGSSVLTLTEDVPAVTIHVGDRISNINYATNGALFQSTATIGTITGTVDSNGNYPSGSTLTITNSTAAAAITIPSIGFKYKAQLGLQYKPTPAFPPNTPYTGIQFVSWPDTLTGTDNTNALQQAINFALLNQFPDVELPIGKYLISDTIMLGWGFGTVLFAQISLRGNRRGGYDANWGTAIFPTQKDRPAINIQGGRNCGVFGIAIKGRNFLYNVYSVGQISNTSENKNDWLAPNLAASGTAPGGIQPHSPYCGIAVDAYAGDKSFDFYPDRGGKGDQLPGDTRTSVYQSAVSSDTTIDDCSIGGFAVQIVNQPNGDGNGDFTRIRNCFFHAGVYGIVIANTQSRSVELRNNLATAFHTVIKNYNFGRPNGSSGATTDTNIGTMIGPIDNFHCDLSFQVFDVITNMSLPLVITAMYSEALCRIGNFLNSGADSCAIVFNGGSFSVDDQITHAPKSLITATVPVSFNGTNVRGPTRIANFNDGVAPLYFVNNTMRGGRNNGTSAASIRAINYTGGIFAGGPRFNANNVNEVFANTVNGTYYKTAWAGFAADGSYNSTTGVVTLTLDTAIGSVGDMIYVSRAYDSVNGLTGDITFCNGAFTITSTTPVDPYLQITYNSGVTGKVINAIKTAKISFPVVDWAMFTIEYIPSTQRREMNQYIRTYVDSYGRSWRFSQPFENGPSVSITSYVNDLVTFTYDSSNETNGTMFIFEPGDMIYHYASATLYIIETVSAVGVPSGTLRTITARQQNRLLLAYDGTWIKNLGATGGSDANTGFTSVSLIKTGAVLPRNMAWGTIAVGSDTFSSVDFAGDGVATQLNNNYKHGDPIFGNTSLPGSWIGNGNYIKSVTPYSTSPGAIVMRNTTNPNTIITGTRQLIFPYELR